MATIPREIYTLGAVQFDTRPLARLQGELLAKKAAQEEALDKYLFDLQGKLPKDQVRAIDRNPFQQKVQNWISKGIALRKQRDKFGAQQEILSGFQELMADANESKAASERQQKIAELKLQGKLDAKDFPIIDKMSRSIYDVNFYKKPEIKQPYTIEDFSVNVPTWDLGKRKQFIDFALSGTTPAGKENLKTIEDKENLTQTTTYDKVFTPEQKKDISKKALAILSDKSGIKTYEEILKEGASATPTKQFIDLVAAYNSVFPNDLMNSPEKVAAADIILNMSGVRMPGTPITTPLFKKREQFKSGVRMGEQKVKEGQGDAGAQETIGNAFDSIDEIQGVYPDIKISKGKGTIAGIEYTGTISTKGSKLPEVVRAPLRNIKYEIGNNEDVEIKVENGQIVSIKPKGRSLVDRNAMRNAQLKFSTEPQKGPQMRFAEKEKEGVKTTSKKTGASGL